MMFKFLDEIGNFSKITEDFDDSQYLTNQKFINTLNYAKKDNVCDVLSQVYYLFIILRKNKN